VNKRTVPYWRDLTGTLLIIKFIHASKIQNHARIAMQMLFGISVVLLLFASDLFEYYRYMKCTNRWAGLYRQWCRSRPWSSSAEAGADWPSGALGLFPVGRPMWANVRSFVDAQWHNNVTNSESINFFELGFNKSCFLTNEDV